MHNSICIIQIIFHRTLHMALCNKSNSFCNMVYNMQFILYNMQQTQCKLHIAFCIIIKRTVTDKAFLLNNGSLPSREQAISFSYIQNVQSICVKQICYFVTKLSRTVQVRVRHDNTSLLKLIPRRNPCAFRAKNIWPKVTALQHACLNVRDCACLQKPAHAYKWGPMVETCLQRCHQAAVGRPPPWK